MNKLQPIQDVLPEIAQPLEDIKHELDKAWHTRQIFRTETEARYAVLNEHKYPTRGAKYWQSVREQCVHFDELLSLSFELRRKEIELKKIESRIDQLPFCREIPCPHTNLEHWEQNYEKDRLEVDRDELLFHIASGKQVAKNRVREVMMWEKFKKEVNDGSFDTEDPNTHQKESLFKSVANRARVAPKDISAEEQLSIAGILDGLGKLDVNKELYQQLLPKKE